MRSPTKALLTAGLGAVAMYYFDPAHGRRRRDLARDRIEHGRDNLQKVSHTALAVGHDVGSRADRTIHRLRAVGRDFSHRADELMGHARAAGHDIGERAGRFTHGLTSVGRDAGHRASNAVSSAGSMMSGHLRSGHLRSDHRVHGRRSGPSPLRLVGIPVKWLFIAGIGACVMYLFDPSQGIYRRARLRNRIPRQRMTNSAGRDSDAAYAANSEEPLQAGAHQRAGEHRDARTPEQPLPG